MAAGISEPEAMTGTIRERELRARELLVDILLCNFKEKLMTNDKNPTSQPQNENESHTHPIATGLGAAAGGVAGAALGNSTIGGKVGSAIGGVAGAIAGAIAGNTVAQIAAEAIDEIQPALGLGLGANDKPIQLPRHYTWEELQALSKPHGGEIQIHGGLEKSI